MTITKEAYCEAIRQHVKLTVKYSSYSTLGSSNASQIATGFSCHFQRDNDCREQCPFWDDRRLGSL